MTKLLPSLRYLDPPLPLVNSEGGPGVGTVTGPVVPLTAPDGLPIVSPGLTMSDPSKPPLKRPYSRVRVSPPAGRVACGRLLPLSTPHAIRLCIFGFSGFLSRRVFDVVIGWSSIVIE
jgi:hypothetical protein